LNEEPREKLHLELLRNLRVLACRVSHLWTKDNLADLIAYTLEQQANETLLLVATDILCKLAVNANIYLLSVFSQADTGLKFKSLIELNMFHSRDQIAFNICLLATTLLVAQSKTTLERNIGTNMLEETSSYALDELFQLTKSGLFSMVLDFDAHLEAYHNLNESEKSRHQMNSLLKVNLFWFYI
jgi:hypothetical protein